MVSNSNQSIDNAVDEKLKSVLLNLLKYSKIDAIKRNPSNLTFKNLFIEELCTPQKDSYNNEFYNYLNQRAKKTRSKFNLLKLFKPGEILSSVSGI